MSINTYEINGIIIFFVSKQHNHAWLWQWNVWLSVNYTYLFINKWQRRNVFFRDGRSRISVSFTNWSNQPKSCRGSTLFAFFLSRLLQNQSQFYQLKWATNIFLGITPRGLFYFDRFTPESDSAKNMQQKI